MARHKGIIGTISQMQRDAGRRRSARLKADAQQMRALVAAQREAKRAYVAYERAQHADARERQRLYVESRTASANVQSEECSARFTALSTVLADTISYEYAFDVNSLKKPLELPEFDPASIGTVLPPPTPQQFVPADLTTLQRMMPGAKERHSQATTEGYHRYEYAYAMYKQQEYARQCQLAEAWS